MKRFFTVIAAVLFIFTNLYSLSEEKHLGIQPTYTLLNGKMIEYVFVKDSSRNSDVKMSELDWPLTNISYLGTRIDFGWKNFEINGDFAKAISHKTSPMDDYDWLDYTDTNDGIVYKDTSMCTNRSTTENELKNSYMFNINAGARFNPVSTLQIIPLVGFSFNYANFYSAVGYMWYGTSSYTGLSYNVPYTDKSVKKKSTIDPEYVDKDVNIAISYDRICYNFTLGLDAYYTFFDKLTAGVSFKSTPYTYIKAVDHHYATYTYYLDIMSDYFKTWEFGTSAEYRIWKGLAVTTSFNFHIQQLTKGINYETMSKDEKETPKFYQKNKSSAISGCESQWWTLVLGIKWNF